MNHTQILYFLAVARCKSFSEAARQLFIAQSAISKQIQSLEKYLGIKLFIRTNRTVELTPAGEVMYKELQKYNDWLTQIIDMANQIDRGKAGTLNIGVLHGLDLNIDRVNSIARFLTLNPDIQVNVQRVKLEDAPSVLELGIHDVIISYSFLVPDYRNINLAVLETEHDGIVISKDHPIGRARTVSPDHLRNYPLITISPDVSRYAYLNSLNYLTGLGVSPKTVNHVPTIEDIMLSVEFGLGYGIGSASSRLTQNVQAFKYIDMYESVGDPPQTDIIAIWQSDNKNSSVKQFEEFLIKKLKLDIRKNDTKKS